MNIWLKLRKTAAITLCELLAIATIFTGCASTDLSGTEGAEHAAGAVVAGEDSSGALGSKDNADDIQGGSDRITGVIRMECQARFRQEKIV